MVTLPPSAGCLLAQRLASDPDRLRAAPRPTLVECGAVLTRAIAALGAGRISCITDCRERAHLKALRGAIVTEIRSRDIARPPPPAA